jgi:hypothetical protein
VALLWDSPSTIAREEGCSSPVSNDRPGRRPHHSGAGLLRPVIPPTCATVSPTETTGPWLQTESVASRHATIRRLWRIVSASAHGPHAAPHAASSRRCRHLLRPVRTARGISIPRCRWSASGCHRPTADCPRDSVPPCLRDLVPLCPPCRSVPTGCRHSRTGTSPRTTLSVAVVYPASRTSGPAEETNHSRTNQTERGCVDFVHSGTAY